MMMNMRRKLVSKILLLWVAPFLILGHEAAVAHAQRSAGTLTNRADVAPLTVRTSKISTVSERTERSRAGARKAIKIRVRAGDTLAGLAARFETSSDEIARANSIQTNAQLKPGQELVMPPSAPNARFKPAALSAPASSDDVVTGLRLTDGTTIEVDDAWETAQGVWYRRNGVTHLIDRNRVSALERRPPADEAPNKGNEGRAQIVDVQSPSADKSRPVIWIHLFGGARFEVDEVTETDTGAWYRRGTLSVFLESSRIERIERSQLGSGSSSARAWTERGWTTGNPGLDALIRRSGQAHSVDPYLIFCVMEQESRFNYRAVSPKGARGLMQLMPGTAARFGVKKIFDPAQNIDGGTRYLKLLLEQFSGRVDLVLASYNAGEGAVMKYGGNVPPYRETRDYVRRIGARYGKSRDAGSFVPAGGPRLR